MQKSLRYQVGLLVVAWLTFPQFGIRSFPVGSGQPLISEGDELSSPKQTKSRSIQLIVEDELLATIRNQIPPQFTVTGKSELDAAKIDRAISEGDSLVWIGEGGNIPRDLWVGAFKPSSEPLRVTVSEHSPIILNPLPFRASNISSGYIQPPKEMVLHNVDEEPFADFLPILEARDRFDQGQSRRPSPGTQRAFSR